MSTFELEFVGFHSTDVDMSVFFCEGYPVHDLLLDYALDKVQVHFMAQLMVHFEQLEAFWEILREIRIVMNAECQGQKIIQ